MEQNANAPKKQMQQNTNAPKYKCKKIQKKKIQAAKMEMLQNTC